jgi:drug/metabolite transporter (DMT)-like permease
MSNLSSEAPSQKQVAIVLVTGILAVSTAAVFIRLAIAATDTAGVQFSLFLAAARLVIASTVLLPTWRTMQFNQLNRQGLGFAIAAGVCLAAHFAAWITSLTFTSIAASATLVTTNPIWVALISWVWFKEAPNRITALGIVIALMGGGLIASSSDSTAAASHPLLGNLLAIVGAIMASFYFLLGREAQQRGLSIGRYAAIAYTTGAFVLLPLPLLVGGHYLGYPATVYFYTLMMALAAQVIGHTAINWSVRWVSPTLVTLALLFEPVGASVLGYIVFEEAPSSLVLIGAVVVLIGVTIAVVGDWNRSNN